MWSKMKFFLKKDSSGGGSNKGRSRQNLQTCGLHSVLSVNEEYVQAFRTKSYSDILDKVRAGFGNKLERDSSAFTPLSQIHEHLLEPQQEKLMALVGGSNLHQLLMDYINGGVEAFKVCSLLLNQINQARRDYKIIQRALRLSRMTTAKGANCSRHDCRRVLVQLLRFAGINNPLAASSQAQFGQVHDLYRSMLGDLTTKSMKARRRAKLIGFGKKASGVICVVIIGSLVITSLVVVVHTSLGIAALVPVILCSSSGLLRKRKSRPEKGYHERPLVRLAAQLDAAAKGAYIVVRDFDMMSHLVSRLHDEIEHKKAVIGLCSRRSQTEGLLREALKEFESEEACFLERLDELEAHIYLSFLTINRARKLLLQELQVHQ